MLFRSVLVGSGASCVVHGSVCGSVGVGSKGSSLGNVGVVGNVGNDVTEVL